MKKILLSIILVSFAFVAFSQETIVASNDNIKVTKGTASFNYLSEPPDNVSFTVDSTEYDYFAAYLAIQTSEVTQQQLEFTKKLMKYVKQNHGILYIVLQSGTPPCIPTPTQPCPKN